MARMKVIQGSETNTNFMGKFRIPSSLRNGWQKIWKFAKFMARKKHTIQILRAEDDDQQLIPELPNEIVVGEILPKLTWKDFHVLSLVSRGWYETIHSHPFYGDELFDDDEQHYHRARHPGDLLRGRRRLRACKSILSKIELKPAWRVLEPSKKDCLELLVLCQGHPHNETLRQQNYYAGYYDWENFCGFSASLDLYRFLFAAIGWYWQAEFLIHATRMINADLFVVVGLSFVKRSGLPTNYEVCLLRSKGFGTDRKKITWEKLDPSLSINHMLGVLGSDHHYKHTRPVTERLRHNRLNSSLEKYYSI